MGLGVVVFRNHLFMDVRRPSCSFSHHLVEVLTQPAAIIDGDCKIFAANEDFCNAFANLRDVSVGDDLAGHLDAHLPRRLATLVRAARRADAGKQRVSVQLPSGPFFVSVDCIDSPDGQARYLCQLTPDLAVDSSRLRFLMNHLGQGVWNFDYSGQSLSVSDAWRDIRRYPADFSLKDASDPAWWSDKLHPDDMAHLWATFEDLIEGGADDVDLQYRTKRADGKWIWILCRAKVVTRDSQGAPLQIVGVDTDITSLRAREIAQMELANKLQLAIGVAGIGLWEYDSATTKVHWDDRMLEIYGLDDNLHDRPDNLWETYLHPEDRDRSVAEADRALAEGRDYLGEYRIVRQDGEIRYLRSTARFIKDAGSTGKLLGLNLDITEDKVLAQELEKARALLEHDSRHDALTGLANRRLLDERTQKMLDRLGPDDSFAALHIDLDHFKKVNDTLGHAVGDQVLVHVADTLTALVGDRGLVCRNGGDEFVVLLEGFDSHDDVETLCQDIVETASDPLILRGLLQNFGLSIGAAFGTGGQTDLAEVFINADVALYAAKSAGRSCYKVFSPRLRAVSQTDMSTFYSLARALDECEVICHYQPQFDSTSLEVIGAEALVRWNCPHNGLLLPHDFIPAAQATGLAPRLDEYVLDRVLADQTRWALQGLDVPIVALNISLDRFLQPELMAQLKQKLQPHHKISFELLETSFLDDAGPALKDVLCQVREAGIRLDLDDFGSGHSSVVALQTLQPDRVKIDRMLIAPLEENPAQIHILEALVRVSTLQGCGVVMEGIETQAQLDAVLQLETEALQGFLLGRPVEAHVFAQTLIKRQAQFG